MIDILSCGYNSFHTVPCDIEHPKGLTHYLLLIVKTKAWFFIDGCKINTEPHMVILFDKNTKIHYGCDAPNYNDDWLHFITTTSEDIELLNSLNIPFNKPIYPPDIHRLSQFIQLATKEFYFPAKNSKLILDFLIRSFLYALSEDITRTDKLEFSHKHYSDFLNLRKKIYNNGMTKYTATELASSMNLSVSYFQHLYKQFFSTTPQNDIIIARLELAKFYLTTSNMSVNSVANFSGYESDIHFMRQFKKFVGVTPTDFRKGKN